MPLANRALAIAITLLAPVAFAEAAPAIDVTGHWEGAVYAPGDEVTVAVDIAAGERGALVGTLTIPSQGLKNFPFWKVGVDGSAVSLELKTGDGGGQTFAGSVSDDGKSIGGDFLVSVFAAPFSLARTGDARIVPPPRSPGIEPSLAGEWRGSLDLRGKPLAMVVTMTNHADGTASGTWASGDGVATPVTIAYDGGKLTLESTVVSATYSGVLSQDGTELSGNIKQGALEQALVFTRVAATR